MAKIQLARGTDEETIPNVRLTRSRDESQGTATFTFENPTAFANDFEQEITGMYMIDEEGELFTREVKGKFIDGKPTFIEATYLMYSKEEWERFMRFMNRYAEANGLEFTKS